jgi:hypothetical protein
MLPSSLEQRTVDDASDGGASQRPERHRKRRAEPVAQHRLAGRPQERPVADEEALGCSRLPIDIS